MKVAYLLSRFPTLSEPWILLELSGLQRHFDEIHIFSLLPPKRGPMHEQAKEWLDVTDYSPFLSADVVKANFHFLRRSPRRYLRAAGRVLRQTFREPAVLLMAVALFPKSVYFAGRMQALGIDHVHTHFVWFGGIAAGIVADLLDLTYSIHAHAFDLFGRNQGNVRAELEGASRIVTISSYHRAYITTLCPLIDPEKIQTIHLGIDTDLLRPPAEDLEDVPIRILSVGRLIEKKGHTYLIGACKLLAERGINFCCLIVGDGPLRTALQAEIDRYGLQGQVTLCGPLTYDRVLQLHQSSHIFVLPAVVARGGDQDGVPVVLMEAMACEVPVVTTSISGIPDLVCHEENGLFVEQRDVVGLAAALERLIADRPLREQLGRNARQKVLEEFQVCHTTERLAAFFRQTGQRRDALKHLVR